MKYSRYSESIGDRLINVAFILSVALLVISLLHQPEVKSTANPDKKPRSSAQLQPLRSKVKSTPEVAKPAPKLRSINNKPDNTRLNNELISSNTHSSQAITQTTTIKPQKGVKPTAPAKYTKPTYREDTWRKNREFKPIRTVLSRVFSQLP